MPTKQSSSLPIVNLIPNIITILGLCAGLFAIRFALTERWEIAVGFIVVAAFMDGLDGRLARLFNVSSSFGANLDSLADFISFIVAPSFLLYLWLLHTIEIRGVGWGLVLFFCICGAIRLARFNSELEEDESPKETLKKDTFFSGVPVPAGAGIILLPIMLSFQLAADSAYFQDVTFVSIYMAVVGLMMVSRVPTFSGKKMTIPKTYTPFVLIAAGMMITGIIFMPWITLPLIGLAYLLHIPVSVYMYYMH